jgi:hypothetical protein
VLANLSGTTATFDTGVLADWGGAEVALATLGTPDLASGSLRPWESVVLTRG